MNDETCQAMIFQNMFDLGFPQFNGTFIQKMEERVVLNCGHGEFEDISNKIRHNRATATVLGIEVGDIGNRHVERKLKGVIPFRLSVKCRSPESLGTILTPIAVDDFHSTQEFFLALK